MISPVMISSLNNMSSPIVMGTTLTNISSLKQMSSLAVMSSPAIIDNSEVKSIPNVLAAPP